jgi:cellulose synthase/poly-beta-1,6-N-acetylglucosamine synthase-like glycosyltransferase
MKVIIIVFLLIYFPVAMTVGVSWLQSDHLGSYISFAVWQLMLAKTIYDTVRLMFAAILAEPILKKQDKLKNYPAVALLYVCRDDVVPECLRDLGKQRYPNYDVYVLDDSRLTSYKRLVDQSPYRIVRRNTGRGYKAGNINYWLENFGNRYKYFVIFDNDSKASPDFIKKMVQVAEHPENQDVGIFQSRVLPWNRASTFPRISGALAPLSMMVLGKLGNFTGTVMSFGHNNLHRMEAIHAIGGFDEELTAEDLAATLMLDRAGYRTVLVDIESFEGEPENIFRFRRRAIRWAAQTAMLFSVRWNGVSGALKFELSRQLMYYIINCLFFGWILRVLWSSELAFSTIFSSMNQLFIPALFDASSLMFIAVMLILVSNHLLAFFLGWRKGIGVDAYMRSFAFTLASYIFTLVPIGKALVDGLLRKRVIFTPSNAGDLQYSFFKILKDSALLMAVGASSLLYFYLSGKNPWAYFGGWWATLFLLLPLILHLFHQNSLEERHEKRAIQTKSTT